MWSLDIVLRFVLCGQVGGIYPICLLNSYCNWGKYEVIQVFV